MGCNGSKAVEAGPPQSLKPKDKEVMKQVPRELPTTIPDVVDGKPVAFVIPVDSENVVSTKKPNLSNPNSQKGSEERLSREQEQLDRLKERLAERENKALLNRQKELDKVAAKLESREKRAKQVQDRKQAQSEATGAISQSSLDRVSVGDEKSSASGSDLSLPNALKGQTSVRGSKIQLAPLRLPAQS